ncbi:MAG TPA: RNA polymerase sigma factor [Candidatus Limnocylindria bacterium]|nr:RNA polymerase sigma factor [Candidatus Limnocylindria bacterium]
METREPDGLVERMQADDLDAFEEFFKTYQRPIYATALAITRDPFLAEEVLQDCFVKAYRVRDRLDPSRSPLPWLQRVAINLCYSRVSRRKVLPEPLTNLITNLVVDLAQRPDQVVESREVLEVLQRGIDALPPK